MKTDVAELSTKSLALHSDEFSRTGAALRLLVLFGLLFVLIAAPAFFKSFAMNSEENPSVFSAAFDLRLFYPGQNRIMAVLPFVTSWLETPSRIALGHFFLACGIVSAGLTVFASSLPRAMFYPFCASLFVLIIVVFGGVRYGFHLSSANPYVVPFSLCLISYVMLSGISAVKGLSRLVLSVVVFLISLAAAGMNPSSTLMLAIFLSLWIGMEFLDQVDLRRTTFRSTFGITKRFILTRGNLLLGLALNLAATAAAFWVSQQYKLSFPQYVRSNYSVESYTNSGLSFKSMGDAFRYLNEMHAPGSLFGVTDFPYLMTVLCLSGIPSGWLWVVRKRAGSPVARYYLGASLLWASAIVVILVLSQNSHVQLVQNLIQGRYYSIPLYGLVLSLCITCAAVAVDFAPRMCLEPWRYAGAGWLAACLLMTIASVLVPMRERSFSADILRRNPTNEALAEKIRSLDIQAILGNYFLIWDIQYELNRYSSGAPQVTPVSIRSEAFGLNVFKPLLMSLGSAKSFRFACVELLDPPPGLDEPCAPQIVTYRTQGGFPLGDIYEIEKINVSRYRLTVAEVGLAKPFDPANCERSQITLRASPVASAAQGRDV
jgi:hypothetical protein